MKKYKFVYLGREVNIPSDVVAKIQKAAIDTYKNKLYNEPISKYWDFDDMLNSVAKQMEGDTY